MARSIDLLRSTAAIVVDHHTVHHAAQMVSIHVLEKTADGTVGRGQDIDGVTTAELGATGDITAAISGDKLVAFVQQLAGVPTSLDVLPSPPAAEPTPAAA